MPASEVDRRGHEAALLPRNGAAESFVSFIPLFGSATIARQDVEVSVRSVPAARAPTS